MLWKVSFLLFLGLQGTCFWIFFNPAFHSLCLLHCCGINLVSLRAGYFIIIHFFSNVSERFGCITCSERFKALYFLNCSIPFHCITYFEILKALYFLNCSVLFGCFRRFFARILSHFFNVLPHLKHRNPNSLLFLFLYSSKLNDRSQSTDHWF